MKNLIGTALIAGKLFAGEANIDIKTQNTIESTKKDVLSAFLLSKKGAQIIDNHNIINGSKTPNSRINISYNLYTEPEQRFKKDNKNQDQSKLGYNVDRSTEFNERFHQKTTDPVKGFVEDNIPGGKYLRAKVNESLNRGEIQIKYNY